MFMEWTGRKRGREDDYEDYENVAAGFGEHRTVRLHSTFLDANIYANPL